MSWAILADTERVMSPDELDWKLHEGCHSESRFHIVGEYEEGTASGDHASVQGHTDADACHGQLGYTCLEEGTREIAFRESVCFLQEAVGLVRVGEVGRSADHVLQLGSQKTQYGRGTDSCRLVGLLLDRRPVDFRKLVGEPVGHFLCLFRVGLRPSLFSGTALSHDLFQFLTAFRVKLSYLREDRERILWVTTQVLDRLLDRDARCRQGLAMCRHLILETAAVSGQRAFTHDGVANDQGWSLCLRLGLDQGLTDLVGVIAIDGDDFPTPRLVFHRDILAGHLLDGGRQLDVVRIVKHDQVIQA